LDLTVQVTVLELRTWSTSNPGKLFVESSDVVVHMAALSKEFGQFGWYSTNWEPIKATRLGHLKALDCGLSEFGRREIKGGLQE